MKWWARIEKHRRTNVWNKPYSDCSLSGRFEMSRSNKYAEGENGCKATCFIWFTMLNFEFSCCNTNNNCLRSICIMCMCVCVTDCVCVCRIFFLIFLTFLAIDFTWNSTLKSHYRPNTMKMECFHLELLFMKKIHLFYENWTNIKGHSYHFTWFNGIKFERFLSISHFVCRV